MWTDRIWQEVLRGLTVSVLPLVWDCFLLCNFILYFLNHSCSQTHIATMNCLVWTTDHTPFLLPHNYTAPQYSWVWVIDAHLEVMLRYMCANCKHHEVRSQHAQVHKHTLAAIIMKCTVYMLRYISTHCNHHESAVCMHHPADLAFVYKYQAYLGSVNWKQFGNLVQSL